MTDVEAVLRGVAALKEEALAYLDRNQVRYVTKVFKGIDVTEEGLWVITQQKGTPGFPVVSALAADLVCNIEECHRILKRAPA